jgi:hypothetical protein
LVEHLWRAYHALPGSTASSLINLNAHFRPRAGAMSRSSTRPYFE